MWWRRVVIGWLHYPYWFVLCEFALLVMKYGFVCCVGFARLWLFGAPGACVWGIYCEVV